MPAAQHPTRYRKLARGPEGFAAYFAESSALLDRATELDAAQRVLADELADIRTRLAELRIALWPQIDPKDIVHGFRRTRRGGPPPIPPAPRNALSLQGRQLRSAVLAILLQHQQPMTLVDIHRHLHLSGYAMASREPVKRLGNVLAYEVEKGRARRVGRATYELGLLNPGERRRIEKISVASPRPAPL